jgi:hypothetical protein
MLEIRGTEHKRGEVLFAKVGTGVSESSEAGRNFGSVASKNSN